MKYQLLVIFFCSMSFLSAQQQLLTPEKLMEFQRLGAGKLSPDENYFLYSQTQMNVHRNNSTTNWFIINLKNKTTQQISDLSFPISSVQWAGNSIYFIHTENGLSNIWKMNIEGTDKQQISHFTANGKKINSFRIAPNEQFILISHSLKTRKNISEEYEDLPFANARVENELMYRHWDHWDDYTIDHHFYYTITNGKISKAGRDLQENSPYNFGGLESIAFHPNHSKIAYTAKTMAGLAWTLSTNSELYEIDLKTYETTCITCEDNHFQGYDLQPSYSSQGDLAWISMERDGFESDKRNIIVKTKDGNIINITQNHDITIDAFAWHPEGKKIYAIIPYNGSDQVFEIDVKTQNIRQLTSTQHDYGSLSVGKNTIYASRRSMVAPVEYFTIHIPKTPKNTALIEALTTVNKELLNSLAQPTVEERWFETSDGKSMHTWIVLPPNFDSTKTYPTLLYCQGGPQGQVSQFFSYRWNFMLMASQGYVVVAPNRRGLPGFGQEWNDAISKDWGGQAIQDYLTSIDSSVAQLPYIDKNRIGAIGASYGGYSVFMLAGLHQNRFKTFVAHCGLFNLESWYGTTDELFFANWDVGGPYWQDGNSELYKKHSPHNFVKNWNTPILVIHGGLDFRVPETEGMQAFHVAQMMGIKSRFLHFPKEGHWVLTPQNSLVWHREFFKWLAEDLK